MSASKATAQFYDEFAEPEADIGDKTEDDIKIKDTAKNGKPKKTPKFRKMAKAMIKRLRQEKQKECGHTKINKQEDIEDWKKRLEVTEKKLAQLKSSYDDAVLQSHIQQTKIDNLEREKADLLTRLSMFAGDRPRQDNAHIIDISDVHRPDKLRDAYSELYDNEWSDAFQEFTENGLTETEAIGTLLHILLVCFDKCREITWERYQKLRHIVSTIDIADMPRCVENVSEVECQDIANNASMKLEVSQSQNKEGEKQSEEHPSHSEEVRNPELCNNASSELEKEESQGIELERPTLNEQNEATAALEDFPQTNGTDLDLQNGSEINLEKTTPVTDSSTCIKYALKELNIPYSGKMEVEHSRETKEEHFTITATLLFEQEKQIKDIWRKTTNALKNEAVKNLCPVLLTSFNIQSKGLEKTSTFLTSCIDLCWNMNVQEKPMHLETVANEDIKSAKKFDLDKFKAFTKSGEIIDFIVWPALLLHEGGPTLCRGIAQGRMISDK